MNTELKIKVRNDCEEFKLTSSSEFIKTIENVRKYRDTRPEATDRKRNRLVAEPNYHPEKWYSEKLLAVGMNKTEVKMN